MAKLHKQTVYCLKYPDKVTYRELRDALKLAKASGLPVSVKLNGSFESFKEAALALKNLL